MKKIKVRRIYKQLLSLIAIPFLLSGCESNNCDITERHVHKYVGSNKRGTIVNYLDSENPTIYNEYQDVNNYTFEYKKQNEYIEITKDDEEFYKVKGTMFYGPDNWDLLYNIMSGKKDYIEYEYTYSDGEDTYHRWNRNAKDNRNYTGKVRVTHYRFCGHKIVYKDGKYINVRSPFVDDIREIIDEYPYFEIDCYKQFTKDYKYGKKEVRNIRLEDVDEFKGPDLSNKELNTNTK